MNFMYLVYFKKIAECGSVSKAAEELYISQPALSRAVKLLEDEVGYKLFDREGKRIVLNKYGHKLLEKTNLILSQVDALGQELYNVDTNRAVNIASSYETYLSFFSRMMLENYPTVKIILKPKFNLDSNTLLTGENDIVITSFETNEFENVQNYCKSKSIKMIYLFNEKILISVPADHPLSKRDNISIHEIEDTPMVTISNIYNFNIYLDEFLKKHNTKLKYEKVIYGESQSDDLNLLCLPYPMSSIPIGLRGPSGVIANSERKLIKLTDKGSERAICIFCLESKFVHLKKYIYAFIDELYSNYTSYPHKFR